MNNLEKRHILVVCRTKKQAGNLFHRWIKHVKSKSVDPLNMIKVSSAELTASDGSMSYRFIAQSEVCNTVKGTSSYEVMNGCDVDLWLDSVETKEKET